MVHRGVLGLTPRQELYLRGVCRGAMRQEVAGEAFVTDDAVRHALGKIYKHLGVRNAAAACYLLGVTEERARWDGHTHA